MKTAKPSLKSTVLVGAATLLSSLACNTSSTPTPTTTSAPAEAEAAAPAKTPTAAEAATPAKTPTAAEAPTPAAASAAPSNAAGEALARPSRVPVTARLIGPATVAAGQDIELTAEIDRNTGPDQPIALELVLPPGARLVSGEKTELLPGGNGPVARKFIVHLDQVPERDIELVATAGNESFGAKARGAYRYGRPAPRLAEPTPGGKDLVYGGRNLGKPIQLKP